jgi:enhancer of polycomb-like protein
LKCAARSEAAAYVEYDLDNEDEDWLLQLNKECKILSPERFSLPASSVSVSM